MVNYRACEANALVIHLTHTHTKVKIAITDEIQYTTNCTTAMWFTNESHRLQKGDTNMYKW